MLGIRKYAYIALGWLVFSASVQAQALTPADLLTEINRTGPKATIDRLNASSDGKDWDRVIDNVISGRNDWLQIAARLAPGSDAGSATDLEIALAYALPKNPSGVLSVIDGHSLQIDEICGVGFIEPEDAFLRAYLRKTKRALTQMKNVKLKDKRHACLKELNAAEQEIFPSSRRRP
jgi:hypothetical protein